LSLASERNVVSEEATLMSSLKRLPQTPGLTPRRKQTWKKPKMRDSWNQ
jgi:hypothetical protein